MRAILRVLEVSSREKALDKMLRLIPDLCVQGQIYVIDEGIEVVATPGHSGQDVSLIVRNTTFGTLLMAGAFSSINVLT